MNKLILLIIGMTLVTYLPRMLPMLLFSQLELPPFLVKFFKFIPYTALTALIFPAVLNATPDHWSGIFGALLAALFALRENSLFTVVFSSIAAALCWQLFFI
jgi:branched-subunit amino acid transport protein